MIVKIIVGNNDKHNRGVQKMIGLFGHAARAHIIRTEDNPTNLS